MMPYVKGEVSCIGWCWAPRTKKSMWSYFWTVFFIVPFLQTESCQIKATNYITIDLQFVNREGDAVFILFLPTKRSELLCFCSSGMYLFYIPVRWKGFCEGYFTDCSGENLLMWLLRLYNDLMACNQPARQATSQPYYLIIVAAQKANTIPHCINRGIQS